MPVILILGGARSGKSRRAEAIATSLGESPIYIATAPLIEGDDEWLKRITRHREERGAHWQVVEEGINLTGVLKKHAKFRNVVLVDCLTLWLSNLIYADMDIETETAQLCELLPELPGYIIFVTNEVGMGLVPENARGRAFRDAQGRLNQQVATVADQVEFIAAGLPICLKGDTRCL